MFDIGEKCIYNLWDCKDFPCRQLICEATISKKLPEQGYEIYIDNVLLDTASGNGFYDFLCKTHKTTNASSRYLFKVIKNGSIEEGGKDEKKN